MLSFIFELSCIPYEKGAVTLWNFLIATM